MINFGKTAAALSALALVATPVVASAAPAAGAQRLSLANAPVARSSAKVKKSSKIATLPIVLGAVVLGVGVAAAAGAFDSNSK